MDKLKEVNDSRPLMVTIRCMTYNHESYIRQCLEGFVMQKTDFRFEAVVHDDASTDGTAVIIQEYAEKYPDIIKPIYETENQYSKGNGSLKRIMEAHTHGKYVAMCEGDDYWTDPLKLQKQVDFLESHPEHVMCSHFWNEYIQQTGEMNTCRRVESKDYSLANLINEEWLFQPLTVVYRRSAFDLSEYDKYGASRDIVMFYELLKHGKGFCFPDIMGVYRLHSGGVWMGQDSTQHWLSDFKMRKAIYEKERTDEAAQFLLNVIVRNSIGRSWLLRKQAGNLFYIFRVSCKHIGTASSVKTFFRRFLFTTIIKSCPR